MPRRDPVADPHDPEQQVFAGKESESMTGGLPISGRLRNGGPLRRDRRGRERQDRPRSQLRDRLERADRFVLAPVLETLSSPSGPTPMALVFKGYELTALTSAAVIATTVITDGDSTWVEGVRPLEADLCVWSSGAGARSIAYEVAPGGPCGVENRGGYSNGAIPSSGWPGARGAKRLSSEFTLKRGPSNTRPSRIMV
jgi:hypothetical protein